MKMKKILAAAMAAALLTGTLAMGGCSSDSGKLVMVTEAGFAPYEYYDGEAVVGVDVDIAAVAPPRLQLTTAAPGLCAIG